MQLCFVLGHPLDLQWSAMHWDWTLSLYQDPVWPWIVR